MLKNLLSNAFKFTDHGSVKLRIQAEPKGVSYDSKALNEAERVISFAVKDTGIGIPKNKQQLIFEAFQQADGTTSRKYGGTGLGLSISREIARHLGGELRVESTVGKGSTFTLYLPVRYEKLDSTTDAHDADEESADAETEAFLDDVFQPEVMRPEVLRTERNPDEKLDDRDKIREAIGCSSSSETT